MGQDVIKINHKQIQKDIELYQWRSISSYNQNLAKINLINEEESSKQAINFFQLLACKYPTINLNNYQHLKKKIKLQFENYVGNLSNLLKRLSFESCLYVMICLLDGIEQITRKFGKALVNPQCCFITANGEIRIWINSDIKLNDFQMTQMTSQLHELLQSNFLNYNLCLLTQNSTTLLQNIIILISLLCSELNKLRLHAFIQELYHQTYQNMQQLNIYIIYRFNNYSFAYWKKFIHQYIYKNKILINNQLNSEQMQYLIKQFSQLIKFERQSKKNCHIKNVSNYSVNSKIQIPLFLADKSNKSNIVINKKKSFKNFYNNSQNKKDKSAMSFSVPNEKNRNQNQQILLSQQLFKKINSSRKKSSFLNLNQETNQSLFISNFEKSTSQKGDFKRSESNLVLLDKTNKEINRLNQPLQKLFLITEKSLNYSQESFPSKKRNQKSRFQSSQRE